MNFNKLLNKEPIKIDLKKCLSYVKNKRVLITGAGGSIGSEISKQMLYGGAERLYLLGHGENSIYKIQQELLRFKASGIGADAKIVPIIGEIQDRDYIYFLMERLRTDIIFHTAAHKHVPLLENNAVEAIKNNVFGTKNMIDASKDNGVSKFVLISTDKAVDPICIYGASKFLAEALILKERASHKFLAVRFGNVIGSMGSVLPFFEKQILSGLSVPITDIKATRFFMSIEEAVSLILEVGQVGIGGEVYILDMGEPENIYNIARKMIKHYNKNNDIVFTGLRAGEKLTEELWSGNEIVEKTNYSKILRLTKKNIVDNIDDIIIDLKPICFFDRDFPHFYRNKKELGKVLGKIVPTLKLIEDKEY